MLTPRPEYFNARSYKCNNSRSLRLFDDDDDDDDGGENGEDEDGRLVN